MNVGPSARRTGVIWWAECGVCRRWRSEHETFRGRRFQAQPKVSQECNFAVRLYDNLARVEKARGSRRKRSLGYRCRLATISGRRAISFDPGNLADKLLRNYSGGSTTLLGPGLVRISWLSSHLPFFSPVYT